MRRVPQLNWPQHLFALPHLNVATAIDSTASLRGVKPKDEELCACGCKTRHNLAVSRVVGDSHARRVLWYATSRCKFKHMGKQ